MPRCDDCGLLVRSASTVDEGLGKTTLLLKPCERPRELQLKVAVLFDPVTVERENGFNYTYLLKVCAAQFNSYSKFIRAHA